jgi:hypothetical protein
MDPKFVSRADFAQGLGVSIATLNRGMRNRTYPFSEYTRIGKRVLFRKSLFDEIIKHHSVNEKAEASR